MKPSESEEQYGVQKSILEFTTDISKIFAKEIKGNYVCSTLSAHMALSMAAYGAEGNTAAQMRKALHLYDSNFELLRDYRRIINILKADENVENDREMDESFEEEIHEILENEDMSEEEQSARIQERRIVLEEYKARNRKVQCVATLASKIYICSDHRVTVQQRYEDALRMCFQSNSETLNSHNPHTSADNVNNWCIETTDGKISDIIDPDEFTDANALILVNAVHFRGNWLSQFVSARPKVFHLNMFKKIQVPTMYIKKELPYRHLGEMNARAVRLDFARSEKYMEIIVPNRINGLRMVKKLLYRISSRKFKYTNVRLWLPKFEIQSEIKFENHLKKMGDAFEKDWANFDKICDNELYIKTVKQKAYIKVDELGCEAAAMKVPWERKKQFEILKKHQKNPLIKANKPFLFRIMDSRLDIPLYIGTVVNPLDGFKVNKQG